MYKVIKVNFSENIGDVLEQQEASEITISDCVDCKDDGDNTECLRCLLEKGYIEKIERSSKGG